MSVALRNTGLELCVRTGVKKEMEILYDFIMYNPL